MTTTASDTIDRVALATTFTDTPGEPVLWGVYVKPLGTMLHSNNLPMAKVLGTPTDCEAAIAAQVERGFMRDDYQTVPFTRSGDGWVRLRVATEPADDAAEPPFDAMAAQRLLDERDARIRALEGELRRALERHVHDMTTVGEALVAEANVRNWCREYDTFMSSLSGQLHIPLPSREREYDVTLHVSAVISGDVGDWSIEATTAGDVTVTVTAANEDEAGERGQELLTWDIVANSEVAGTREIIQAIERNGGSVDMDFSIESCVDVRRA
jgi:hypothetical protein